MFFQFQFLCNLRYMLSKALVVAVGARIVFEIMFCDVLAITSLIEKIICII
jgi:hypothetical protein